MTLTLILTLSLTLSFTFAFALAATATATPAPTATAALTRSIARAIARALTRAIRRRPRVGRFIVRSFGVIAVVGIRIRCGALRRLVLGRAFARVELVGLRTVGIGISALMVATTATTTPTLATSSTFAGLAGCVVVRAITRAFTRAFTRAITRAPTGVLPIVLVEFAFESGFKLGRRLRHIERRLAVGLADFVALFAGEQGLMSLDLDREFGALGEHFLAGELDLLCNRVDANRIARLARRRWRGSHALGRCGAGRSVGILLLLRLLIVELAIATATAASTPAPTATSASAAFAFVALLCANGIRRRIASCGALAPSRFSYLLSSFFRGFLCVERIGDAEFVFVDVGQILETS